MPHYAEPGLPQFLFILGCISSLGLTVLAVVGKVTGYLTVAWGWVCSPVPIFLLFVVCVRVLIALAG
jgi:hypothetical protein